MISEQTLPPWETERRLVDRIENVTTNPAYGSYPEDRVLSRYIKFGVICVDKPKGPTSHQVTDMVRNITGVDHVGHGGTLEAGEIPQYQVCYRYC